MEYNAVIREYNGQSLTVLTRVLIADLNDFPDEFEQFRYQDETLDLPIDMKELCCSPTNPVQIYKPVEHGFQIFVRTLDNRQWSLVMRNIDTVKLLKLKIFLRQKQKKYRIRRTKNKKTFQIVPENLVVSSASLQMRYKLTDKPGVWRDDFQFKGTDTKGQHHEVIKLEKNLGWVEIISVEPWRSPYVCGKCDTWISFKGDQWHLDCGHVYHKWCKPTVLQGLKCVICSSKLFTVGEDGVELDDVLEYIHAKELAALNGKV